MLDVVRVRELVPALDSRAHFLPVKTEESRDGDDNAGRDEEPDQRMQEGEAFEDLVDCAPGPDVLEGLEEKGQLAYW